MLITECPKAETLRDYLEDRLPPDLVSHFTTHIDDCIDCQSRLDMLVSGNSAMERIKELGAKADGYGQTSHPSPATSLLQTTPGIDGLANLPPITVGLLFPSVPGYTVTEEIGRGGMGVVYRAVHRRLNRVVAIKMVLAGGLVDPRVTQRFLLEAEVLGRVRHAQVVQIFEAALYTASTGVSIPYLAMEYLEGGTLEKWSGGRQHPPREAAEIIEGIAAAVHVAHGQGIVHRDLKPANILRSGEGVFKVTDFGLAKLTAETTSGLTGTGMVMGTPAYMAPEQAAGEKGIGPPADVYSLGAMLFELLSGQPPFTGAEAMSVLLKVMNSRPPDVRSVRREVPRDLSAIVSKCLSKEPDRRYGSAAELADDLARFREGRPTRARVHSTPERLWYWAKRNPTVAALLSILAIVLPVGFVCVLILWGQAEANAVEMAEARDAATRESREAELQRDEAARLRREADSREAYLTFDRAVRLCDGGQLDEGLRGFVRALELAEKTADLELARVVRINIAAWKRELYPPARFFLHSETATLKASGFSPDGKWVYTAGTDNRICIWDAETGKKIAVLTDPDPQHIANRTKGIPLLGDFLDRPQIRSVAINTDCTRIAATLDSGAISVWQPSSPKPLISRRLKVAEKPVLEIWSGTFDQEGYLWVGADGGVLARVDPTTGDAVESLPLPLALDNRGQLAPTSVHCLRLSRDGTRLYSGDRAGRLLEWDLKTKTCISNDRGIGGWVYDIDEAPDGQGMVIGGSSTAAHFPANSAGWVLSANGSEPGSVRFTHGGRCIAVGESDGKVKVVDVRTRTQIGSTLRVGRTPARLATRTGGFDLLIPRENGASLQPLLAIDSIVVPDRQSGYDARVLDFDFTGKRLLVGAGDLFVADTETGKTQTIILSQKDALAAKFLGKGSAIVYGLRGSWGIYDLEQGKVRYQSRSDRYMRQIITDPVTEALCIQLFGKYQKVSSEGRLLDTGALKGINPQVIPTVAGLAPGGREIRFCIGNELHFFDLQSGNPTKPSYRFRDEIRAMGQSVAVDRVVVGLRDQSLQVLDAVSQRAVIEVPPRHDLAITSVAISPDGATVLSGSRDQSARYWDTKSGLALGPRLRHANPVSVVAYSPTANRVATGTHAGRIVIWRTPPKAEAAEIDRLRAQFQLLDDNSWPQAATYR